MQRVLYADVMDDETEPHVRAACARAYDVLQERRDILRMRPAPKPIDVSDRQKRKRGVKAPVTVLPVPSDAGQPRSEQQ